MERNDLIKLSVIFLIFGLIYFLPTENERLISSVMESFRLLRWYAREHVILCLLTAFFIAGSIGIFLSQQSVMKYLGAGAKKSLAYGVASVSGSILAVCSCTVLPLFAGIYKMGAGLGPATAFLYSGPAINVLAIILTAKILGTRIGVARGVLAVIFSIIIGLLMAFIFRNDESEKKVKPVVQNEESSGNIGESAFIVFSLMLILIFANWGKTSQENTVFYFIYKWKWIFTAVFSLISAIGLHRVMKIPLWQFCVAILITSGVTFIPGTSPNAVFLVGILLLGIILYCNKGKASAWLESTTAYAIQIMPLLFAGVAIAGFALGTPGHEGIIPSAWVEKALGGNGIISTFTASLAGALMYFATLTEVPIIQGLMDKGMGEGPAIALLLAGPALSLPNMLVIRSIMGTKKTLVFVGLVVVLSTLAGYSYVLIFN
ncbi:MAG: permease [Deltaproteobacteria bacterium]|nr:permease [Deltaproteobacteria bacterium]